MLQIYNVALSAGKAHREHKHHHVHQFGHEGPLTTTSPVTLVEPTHSQNSLIANGQFTSNLRINLASAKTTPQPLVQLLKQPPPNGHIFLQQLDSKHTDLNSKHASKQTAFTHSVQSSTNYTKHDSFHFIDGAARHIFRRAVTHFPNVSEKGKVSKRGLVVFKGGSIFGNGELASTYQLEGLAQYGFPAFQNYLKERMTFDDDIKEYDREPAEDEVRVIMEVCTSCDIEPFKDAIALTWKNLRVSLQGVLKGRSVGGCGFF